MPRLATDVLICLFDGEIQQLDISLKPEGLHFGFEISGTDYTLKLRDPTTGEEKENRQINANSYVSNNRVINLTTSESDGLITEIKNQLQISSLTSADLALQMIQGAEKVRFTINSSAPK